MNEDIETRDFWELPSPVVALTVYNSPFKFLDIYGGKIYPGKFIMHLSKDRNKSFISQI